MGQAKKRKRLAVAAGKPTQAPQHQQVISGTNKTHYFPALLLILATALLYGHSLWNPLVFDDPHVFVDANLERLGSSLFQLDLRWFPYASFGWTYKLVGLDWFWYRLGNLGLHAFTGILLFVFFTRLLDATAQPQDPVTRPRWPAFFAALVFVLHPAAVYGVAYLVQRSIVMATLFGIAALLCYLEGLSRDKARWFVLSALFYFLAVFSKEHSIMIPGVAAALTLLLHKPSLALLKRVWLPFALYLAIGVLIILRTKGLLGATYEPVAAEMLSRLSEQQQEVNIANAYGLSVITQGYLFFKYLLLWIAPYTGWMAIDIRQPFATGLLSWPELAGFILFLAYPLLAVRLLLKGGRQGLVGFGLLFPWILYLTELSTVRIQEPFVLYRSYLWMSGLPVVLFGFIGAVPRKFAPVLLAACCLVLAGLAWNRLDTFSDNVKTWTDAINKYQGNNLLYIERSYNNRGMAYMELGELQKTRRWKASVKAVMPETRKVANNYISGRRVHSMHHGAHSAPDTSSPQPADRLTPLQMMDGLALGETTPGPLIMVVAFAGFAGGWSQALFGPGAMFLTTSSAASGVVNADRSTSFAETYPHLSSLCLPGSPLCFPTVAVAIAAEPKPESSQSTRPLHRILLPGSHPSGLRSCSYPS